MHSIAFWKTLEGLQQNWFAFLGYIDHECIKNTEFFEKISSSLKDLLPQKNLLAKNAFGFFRIFDKNETTNKITKW